MDAHRPKYFYRLAAFIIIFLVSDFFIPTINASTTTTLAPTGIGRFDDWSPSDNDNTKIAAVQDRIGNSFISATTEGQTQTFSFSGAGIPDGSTINSVTLDTVTRKDAGSAKIQLFVEIFPASASYNIESLTTSYTTQSWQMTSNPISGNAWSVADVNNWKLNFGVIYRNTGTSSEVHVTQISLTIDYTPSDSKTPTPTPSETLTPTLSPTPTPSASATPSPSPTPTSDFSASMQNPVRHAIGVSLSISPTILFSLPLDPVTINSTGIKLKKYSTSDEISASVSLDVSGTIVTISPKTSLEPDNQYYLTITSGKVKSASGEIAPSWTKTDDESFTTGSGATPLGITLINSTRSQAIAGGDWTDGWQWIFNLTVPDNETQLSLKFGDWTADAKIVLTAGNLRYYSPQSSGNTDADNAVIVVAADTYPPTMMLATDADPTTPGRQVQVIIEVKIPDGTATGSYSANYGIKTQ